MDRGVVVGRLSHGLIKMYEAGDVDGLSDTAYAAWIQHADVLLDAMYLWFRFTIHHKGQDYVRWAVNQITADVSSLAVDEPGSRAAFCDVLYAMYDQSFTKAMAVWQPLRDAGDWPVACEVVSLMLAYIGHFIGVPEGVQTEDTL